MLLEGRDCVFGLLVVAKGAWYVTRYRADAPWVELIGLNSPGSSSNYNELKWNQCLPVT